MIVDLASDRQHGRGDTWLSTRWLKIHFEFVVRWQISKTNKEKKKQRVQIHVKDLRKEQRGELEQVGKGSRVLRQQCRAADLRLHARLHLQSADMASYPKS